MGKKKQDNAILAFGDFDDGKVVATDCYDINVKLAFKQVNKKSPLRDKIICFGTKSKFYHVEAIIGDMWISSDGTNGVHIKHTKDMDEDWVVVELPAAIVTEKQFQDILDWVTTQRFRKYDYFGLFARFIFNLNMHKEDEWFCSEISTAILKRLTYTEVQELEPETVSPGQLAKIYGLE